MPLESNLCVWLMACFSAFLAFTLSASAGMGGSLILVPTLALILGPKEGIAVAALLLAGNNVAKVVAYRHAIELKPAAFVLLLTIIGSAAGAALMLNVPESFVRVSILIMFVVTFVFAFLEKTAFRRASWASFCALAAGATSGFSGTSGPLKGVALRTLMLDRQRFVAAASVVSLAGDLTKVSVFATSSMYTLQLLSVAAAAVPLMFLATWLGYNVNRKIGERAYTVLFWAVLAAYSLRLIG